MVAVGDERRAANLLPHANAEDRHALVAEEADHCGDSDGDEMPDLFRMDETLNRLVRGDDRARQDREHDEYAGEILDAPVAMPR